MIDRILVALDASPRAPSVLAAACEIAKRFGAALVAVRTIAIPQDFPPAAHVDHGDPLPAHLVDVAKRELAVLLGAVSEGVFVEGSRVEVGQPWRAILNAADDVDADLIVIGSHGYHGADRVLGTTAGKVANVARRNVLVVHERPPRGPSRGVIRGGVTDE